MQNNIAQVNLLAIQKNCITLKSKCVKGVKFCAVVKANAYGHGAESVALSLQNLADMFAVATISEGVALRIAGVSKDILVFSPPLDEEDVLFALSHNLIITVVDFLELDILRIACSKYNLQARVHLKMNTGMNRLGLSGGCFLTLCRIISECSTIQVEGIYSHLYAAENEKEANRQRLIFLTGTSNAEKIFKKTLCKHLSATGGMLLGADYQMDMVRVGIGLYGYLPSGFKDINLIPALKVYTSVVQSKKFVGAGIGYKKAEQKYTNVTTYRFGYADGFARNYPIIESESPLCMDMCISDGNRKKGEKVLIFDNAEEYAKKIGTISYEVLCSVTRRADFEYIYE